MTVLIEYVAAKTINTGQTEFLFEWECIGLAAIEVWVEFLGIVPGTFDRVLVRPDLYTVKFNGGGPTYIGGTVILNQPSSEFVYSVSVERNTLITQTVDLQNFSPFKMTILEFILDKLTMILQELAYKKCTVVIPVPILQPYYFDEYTVLSSALVDTSIQFVLDNIALVISTGRNCSTNPEGA